MHGACIFITTHHGTDSVRDLGLLCRNKMLRPARIMVVNGIRSVFLMCQSFQSLSDQFGLSFSRPSNNFFTPRDAARCLQTTELDPKVNQPLQRKKISTFFQFPACPARDRAAVCDNSAASQNRAIACAPPPTSSRQLPTSVVLSVDSSPSPRHSAAPSSGRLPPSSERRDHVAAPGRRSSQFAMATGTVVYETMI